MEMFAVPVRHLIEAHLFVGGGGRRPARCLQTFPTLNSRM